MSRLHTYPIKNLHQMSCREVNLRQNLSPSPEFVVHVMQLSCRQFSVEGRVSSICFLESSI